MGLTPDEFLALPPGQARNHARQLTAQGFRSRVELCSIINIRSRPCAMDCAFCSQNRHSNACGHDLLPEDELLRRVAAIAATPVSHIGLVSTGRALGERDLASLCRILEKAPPQTLPRICLSLGRLSPEQLRRLRDLGIRRYHHNLETGKDFYPRICTTQTWEQRAQTVANALNAGLEICSGALFGLGESWRDRIALAGSLLELGVKYIPLNFLHPQPGTALGRRQPLATDEALRIIGLFRHMLPKATLRVCGGRPITFGERQGEIFSWGANALMTGDYLTTSGQALHDDLRMLSELALEIASQDQMPCRSI